MVELTFRVLLYSAALALAVTDALPHNEHDSIQLGTVDIAGADHLTARGEYSEARVGMMGQPGPAAAFEAGQFAHEKAPLDEAPTSIGSGALPLDNREIHGLHGRVGPRTLVVANHPHVTSSNQQRVHTRLHQHDLDQVEAAIREAVGSVSVGAKAQKRREIEPSLDPDRAVGDPGYMISDNERVHVRTQNRQSHHPGLEANTHRHHPQNRKSHRPRRLREYRGEDNEGDREDTFIAPPSVRIKAGYKPKLRSGTIAVAPTKLVKKPQPTAPTGYYRAVRPAPTDGSTGKGQETDTDGQMDQGRIARRSPLTALKTTPILTAPRPVNTLPVPDGIPGVIDLLSNAYGTRLGSLSVSPTPDVSSDALWNGAATLTYFIDATSNPAEQATFYMLRYDDQTLLGTEPPTNPGALPMHDWLVSLQIAGDSPLCATFNPHARDVQTFGLAICLGTAVSVGNSSQAFRYSPGTGVVRLFYGVEAVRVSAEGVDERVDDLEFGYSTLGSDSNATAVVPGTAPVYFSPDPLLRPVSFFNESAPSSSGLLSSVHGPPILGVQSTSGSARTLVVGDSEVVSRFSVGSKEGEVEDEGVLMVFRRVYESVDEQGGGELEARSTWPMVGNAEFESASTSPDAIMPLRPQSSSPPSLITPLPAPDSTDPTTRYNRLDGSGFDDTPLPKPVINVAYFGDSGRSPPVPLQAQAAGARAILLSVASKDQKAGVGLVGGADEVRVYLVGPKTIGKNTDRVVSVAQAGGRGDSTDSRPVDASD